MAFIEKAVVIASGVTTEYTINKFTAAASASDINTILETIPAGKGSANFSIVDGKAIFAWSGILGSELWIYTRGEGFLAGGVATPALNPKGAWVAGIYKINELVTYGGSVYRSKVSSNSASPTNATNWELFTSNGSGIFSTSASLSSSGSSTIATNTITVPANQTLKIDDLVVSSNAGSQGIVHKITSFSGANTVLSFVTSLRGPIGTTGATGAKGDKGDATRNWFTVPEITGTHGTSLGDWVLETSTGGLYQRTNVDDSVIFTQGGYIFPGDIKYLKLAIFPGMRLKMYKGQETFTLYEQKVITHNLGVSYSDLIVQLRNISTNQIAGNLKLIDNSSLNSVKIDTFSPTGIYDIIIITL